MLHDRALIRRATSRSHAKSGIFSGTPPISIIRTLEDALKIR